jgi:predicted nucleic acid-binding protein
LILVDTSVWIRHFRSHNANLATLLDDNHVAIHDFVIGELACGQLKHREEILSLLKTLPRLDAVPHDVVLFLIRDRKLFGSGIGWVDSHLLASALDTGSQLWTFDKSLQNVAKSCSVQFN